MKAAYVFLQACLRAPLGGEDIVFVGLLGGPGLARSARDCGRLLAPVVSPVPEHAVCGREDGGVRACVGPGGSGPGGRLSFSNDRRCGPILRASERRSSQQALPV